MEEQLHHGLVRGDLLIAAGCGIGAGNLDRLEPVKDL